MFKFPPTAGSTTKETLGVIEKFAPENNEIFGAVKIMLSNFIEPVDDKNMPRLSESVPPLKERSPAQLKVNGDPTIDDEV
jgi:hypothetical protein